MSTKLTNFQGLDWTQVWAGDWSLLSCSQFGEQYTKTLVVNGKVFMSRTILMIEDGKSAGFMTQADKDAFGKHLAQEVVDNPSRVQEITANFKRQVDLMMEFMNKHKTSEITKEIYEAFWERILEYYKPHVNVKYIVDYLDPELLKKYLPILEEARVYAEPVFKHSEEFMRAMAQQQGAKVGYPPELILCLVMEELPALWEGKGLPDQAMLRQRDDRSALLVDPSGQLLRVGEEVVEVDQIIHGATEDEAIKGATAYPGHAKGTVRIIFDPTKSDHFQDGDILVTRMTRPEYLPIMKKAAAIVTDAGGILSHAAITSRELKKPCVIGTNKATKLLKDGDQVEVDADIGIVRIII